MDLVNAFLKVHNLDYNRWVKTTPKRTPLKPHVAQEKLLALASPHDPNLFYETIEKIGSGAAGSVHRGKEIKTGKEVALKFIRQNRNSIHSDPCTLLYEVETIELHPSKYCQIQELFHNGRVCFDCHGICI